MSSKKPKITSEDIAHGIVPFSNLLEMELPSKRVLLNPWLREKEIVLCSGFRGIGKTFFGMAIVDAISKGKKFGPWDAETSVPTLYLDGELAKEDMQDRGIEMQLGKDCKSPVYLYSNDLASERGLHNANLLNEDWRDAMREFLVENGIKLIVIDNISSLTAGIDERTKEDWDPTNQWLLSLRFAGVSSILFHHVSKKGDQRGTSSREDNIDCSILLKHPNGYTPDEGCRFVVHFTKNRVKSNEHHLITDLEFKYKSGKWHWEHAQKDVKFDVYQLLNDGISQAKIAKELGLSAGRISQIKYEAMRDGILTKNGKLTNTGWHIIQN
jgi:hypothetical protein